MSTTSPPYVPSEAWETFAKSRADLEPGATIPMRAHAAHAAHAAHEDESAGDDSNEDTLARPVPPVTIPEIPYLAVAKGGEAQTGAAYADLEVASVLGEGGMGKVLLARQRSLRRDVAIKVLKGDSTRKEAVNTLLAEALVTGSIEHPSVVPIYALGRDEEGRPILVMKRIEGVSWRALTREPDHLVWAAFAQEGDDRLDAHLDILMAVCNAIHFANSRGIVHRDIKLDNVMLGSFGEVYVVDWGIAARAAKPGSAAPRAGRLVGTPMYMSPEMVQGDLSRIDARTDVYLLGATLHAVLTGAPRHRGETLLDVLFSARESAPFEYGPSVPSELAAICNKAMHAEPEQRFQSALELRRAIATYRRHKGSIALSDEAMARLAELRSLSAPKSEGAAPSDARLDERRVHNLMTECRFGFMQALRAWKDNEAAKAGLQGCLEVMIEHELSQRDAEGARSLYTELSEPRPELARRIEALEADIKKTAAREERLRAMERDADLRIGARAQLGIIAIFVLWAGVVSTVVFYRGGQTVGRRDVILSPAIVLVFLLIGIFVGRRQLRTAISRKAFGGVLLVPVSVVVHRLLLTRLDTPLPSVLAGDLIIAAAVAGAIAIMLIPRIGWVALPFGLGAVATTLRPDMTLAIFSISVTTGTLFLLVGWLRSIRSS